MPFRGYKLYDRNAALGNYDRLPGSLDRVRHPRQDALNSPAGICFMTTSSVSWFTPCPPDRRPYVGTFNIKYPPTRAKIMSGDHAANGAGS